MTTISLLARSILARIDSVAGNADELRAIYFEMIGLECVDYDDDDNTDPASAAAIMRAMALNECADVELHPL